MDNTLRLFSRLKTSGDGIELLEFLKTMSKQNYEGFKRSSSDMNDIYKGQALALDGLIELIETCDEKLALMDKSKDNKTEWL